MLAEHLKGNMVCPKVGEVIFKKKTNFSWMDLVEKHRSGGIFYAQIITNLSWNNFHSSVSRKLPDYM